MNFKLMTGGDREEGAFEVAVNDMQDFQKDYFREFLRSKGIRLHIADSETATDKNDEQIEMEEGTTTINNAGEVKVWVDGDESFVEMTTDMINEMLIQLGEIVLRANCQDLYFYSFGSDKQLGERKYGTVRRNVRCQIAYQ